MGVPLRLSLHFALPDVSIMIADVSVGGVRP